MSNSAISPDKARAFSLFQQGRFEEAKTLCTKYCKSNNKDIDAWNLLGAIHGQLNDLNSSKKCFDKIAKLQPDNYQVFFNLSVIQQRTNDLAGAVRNLLKAINLQPAFFEAIYNLADIYRIQGNLEKSSLFYQKAISLKPEYIHSYLNLGSVYRQLMSLDKAIECLEQARLQDQKNDQVLVSLGMVYSDKEMPVEAEDAFKKAIAIHPSNPRAYLQLGILCYSNQLLDVAEKYVGHSITIDPVNPVSHYNLGIIQKDLHKYEEAEASFRKAIELDKTYTNAYQGLASLKMGQGAQDKALEIMYEGLEYNPVSACYYTDLGNMVAYQGNLAGAVKFHQKAVEIDPNDFKTNMGLAYSLYNTNNYDAAIKVFQKSSELATNDSDLQQATANIAIILERRKQYNAAYQLIEPFLSGSNNPWVALAFGNLAKKIDQLDEALDYLQQTLLLEDISHEKQSEILFLLGKLYDGNNQYDKAFDCYHAGNEQFRKVYADQIARYGIEKEKAYINNIKDVFTEEYFKSHPSSGCLSSTPVFVVGMPRSGTTLTESIIASHPQAYGAGEMHDMAEIKKATEVDSLQAFPESMKHMSVPALKKLAEHYLTRLSLKSNAMRIVDKMPHNFLLLGLIAQLFPQSRIIHIQRHPIDNCLSIYFQRFNITHTYATDLKLLGEYYPLYLDLMAHWNQVLPIPILNIKYDELVSNQEAVTREMIDFCGLDWDDACLSFHRAKRDVSTPSYDQVNQPMYNRSSGRWSNYERQIQELVTSLKEFGALDGRSDT